MKINNFLSLIKVINSLNKLMSSYSNRFSSEAYWGYTRRNNLSNILYKTIFHKHLTVFCAKLFFRVLHKTSEFAKMFELCAAYFFLHSCTKLSKKDQIGK